MSTTIPVDDATKSKLDRVREAGETWSEFLERLAFENEPIESGSWSEEDMKAARDVVDHHREQAS